MQKNSSYDKFIQVLYMLVFYLISVTILLMFIFNLCETQYLSCLMRNVLALTKLLLEIQRKTITS